MDIETNVVYITDTTTISGYRNKCSLYNWYTIPHLLVDIETNVVDVTDATTIIGYRIKWTLYNRYHNY